MNNISKIQSEIKAIQKYREEANRLINKINASVEKINLSSEEQIEKIKKKIEKDLQELRQYTSKDIYKTCRISLRDYVEKEPGTDYPLAYFEIILNSVANIHDVDSDAGVSKYNVAIVESCHSYAPVYADGHWADEYPNTARVRNWGKNRNITEVIEILCRNWDSIIAGTYEEIKLAYQKDTKKQLNEALEQEEKAITKYDALSTVKI